MAQPWKVLQINVFPEQLGGSSDHKYLFYLHLVKELRIFLLHVDPGIMIENFVISRVDGSNSYWLRLTHNSQMHSIIGKVITVVFSIQESRVWLWESSIFSLNYSQEY